MNKKEHLPMMGVGPIYGIGIIACTVAGIVASKEGWLPAVRIEGLRVPFLILGILLIVLGISIWMSAIFQAKIDEGILNNSLVTTGVYAYVRNPIYSAFMIACTGALFIGNNCWLLLLPFFYWGFMTILMKHTEEKWLRNLYGEEYLEYCRRVNRCIPWKRSNSQKGK